MHLKKYLRLKSLDPDSRATRKIVYQALFKQYCKIKPTVQYTGVYADPEQNGRKLNLENR